MEYRELRNDITRVLKYFQYFDYPPSFDEIYLFLKTKASLGELRAVLKKMAKEGSDRYTLGEYSIGWKKRYEISQKKLNNFRFRLYIKLLSLFPQIKLVGLSGTLSMMNAREEDDIDLFIITAKDRLFTGRALALIFSILLNIKRARTTNNFIHDRTQNYICWKDKVCLNLFFDESNMIVPKHKQTEYVAHEVLQMKPLVVRDDVYRRFLEANRWVLKIFPNATNLISNVKTQILNPHLKSQRFKFLDLVLSFGICVLRLSTDTIESFLKNLQLRSIKKHQTTEIITPSQLWFHPEDFESKIKNT